MSTIEVHTASITAKAKRSPANRRLIRKRRSVPGTEVASRSATTVNTIIRPHASVITARRMEKARKPGLSSGLSFSRSMVELSILVC